MWPGLGPSQSSTVLMSWEMMLWVYCGHVQEEDESQPRVYLSAATEAITYLVGRHVVDSLVDH